MAITRSIRARLVGLFLVAGIIGSLAGRDLQCVSADEATDAALDKIGVRRGVCVVLGSPDAKRMKRLFNLIEQSELTVYCQSPDDQAVDALREAAHAAGLLGDRLFVDRGGFESIHLADNLADAVVIGPTVRNSIVPDEILRVLRPGGKAISGGREQIKPAARGVDDWSHPYHGPDNNPQSTDQLARAPYLTQFIADPKFSPMPEVTVAAGGRIFKACGHIAHKANQNASLNTLFAVNAYNGTLLWKRPLKEGFMIHRNTMIATPDFLYLADDQSCKRIDAGSGEVADEIVLPEGIADGPVWKWMALEGDVLYALMGGEEAPIVTQPSDNRALGHWPWGMWPGHDYAEPKTSFGFGRTLLAIDPETKNVLWTHREEDHLDSRGICMSNGTIYCYSPGKFLAAVDAATGKVAWKNSSAELLEAIGEDGRAQGYVTGYATTAFIKCHDEYLFFAGPQRNSLAVASTKDGRLLWQREGGNYQLVLRDDAIYAAGPQVPGAPAIEATGVKLDYATGKELARLPMRRACTRATGSIDSIFFRASGGTVRIDTATSAVDHIAPMRPPCQDGVIISDGLLYWGPWMCGCQLSLYGHIGLAPAGSFDPNAKIDKDRLVTGPGDAADVEPLATASGDWPAYRGNSRRTSVSEVAIPRQVKKLWTRPVTLDTRPTAPVTSGGLVFLGDHSGTVQSLDAATGRAGWQVQTGGPIYFPPTVSEGRLYVGSADGWVYAFEATSGKQLWRFRAAPAERWISVFGKLISTWPVAGGLVVEKGVVYAAAGIAHYDTTHVWALDAVSGKVLWHNGTSGALSQEVNSGVSLQGNLYLAGDELRFLGGGVHEVARYDTKTGKCLNEPHDAPNATFPTAFYPYYPSYGKYLSLDHTLADGRSLVCDASYEGSLSSKLALLKPLPPDTQKPVKPESRWSMLRRPKPITNALWQDNSARKFQGFAVSDEVLLAVGDTGSGDTTSYFLAAISIGDGRDIWIRELPSPPVKGGTAVDQQGRLFVSLENGQLVCFSPSGS